MKILVTGGAGFIGSHLSRRLMTRGHKVVIVDNLSSGKEENIPPGADFMRLDVSESGFTARLPVDVEAVCHLAAQSAGAVSAEQPYYDLQANAASTLQLTRWCLARGIKRMLYASSMAVYGNIDKSPVSEEAPCVPIAYYGLSKLTSEHLLRLAAREGLHATSLRMFTVYGPGQDLGNLKQGMVSIYLAYMLKGMAVPVTGSFDRYRDIVYIDDVVDAWQTAAELPQTPSLVYNLGSGRPTTVKELLAVLQEGMSLPSNYPVEEKPGSPSDQFGLFADIMRIQKDLGFSAKVSLREGIRSMADWAKYKVSKEVNHHG